MCASPHVHERCQLVVNTQTSRQDVVFVFIQAQMQSIVRPNATVAIGYCFGGSAVLDLAASWPSMTAGVQG